MAFNALSGTLGLDGQLLSEGQISGSIFLGDGQSLLNVPRITSNPTTDNLLTVGANENSLVGEPNLTFNGSRLQLTGDLTASISISASFFEGDGRRLTGMGAGPGIFTTIDGSNAYVTSSLNIGGTTSADHKLVVSGSVSSSVNVSASAFYGNAMVLAGGLSLNRRSVSTHVTASVTDYYLGIDSGAGAIEVKLLDASLLNSGQTYVLKDEGGSANSNNITILASGSQTIDGQNTIVLMSPYAAISIYCDGATKFFIY